LVRDSDVIVRAVVVKRLAPFSVQPDPAVVATPGGGSGSEIATKKRQEGPSGHKPENTPGTHSRSIPATDSMLKVEAVMKGNVSIRQMVQVAQSAG
jgi:hypothetical protein